MLGLSSISGNNVVMVQTSQSLLDKLKASNDDAPWERLASLYAPILRSWIKGLEFQQADADDLLQEVLTTVSTEIAKFEHNGRTGAFRRWLKTILMNRARNHWRERKYRPGAEGGTDAQNKLDQLEDPQSSLAKRWDREYDRLILTRLWRMVEPRFTKPTCDAFRQQVIERQPAAVVAENLGTSINAVLIAKSRVLKELRREGAGLLCDDDDEG